MYKSNCPHVHTSVSSCILAYVLMYWSMCPYVLKRVSLCTKATVLMFIRLCPHVFEHMSLCIKACVLMHQSNCPHALWLVSSCRYFHNSPNYKYFYNFEFEDYLQRKRVLKTFDIRFRERTEGTSRDTFGLKDPPRWLETTDEMVVTNSVAKRVVVSNKSTTIPSHGS